MVNGYDGLELVVQSDEVDGRRVLVGRGAGQPISVPVDHLQALKPPPEKKQRKCAMEVATDVTRGWLRDTDAETGAVADALGEHVPSLAKTLQPRNRDKEIEAAFRAVRENFKDVSYFYKKNH